MVKDVGAMVSSWIDTAQAERDAGSITGNEAEQGVITKLYSFVEGFDDKIPLIGKYLDLPLADQIQLALIENGVAAMPEWAREGLWRICQLFTRKVYADKKIEALRPPTPTN